MLYVPTYMTLSKRDIVLSFQVVTIGETRLTVHDTFLYCFLQSHVNLLFSKKMKRIKEKKSTCTQKNHYVFCKKHTEEIYTEQIRVIAYW